MRSPMLHVWCLLGIGVLGAACDSDEKRTLAPADAGTPDAAGSLAPDTHEADSGGRDRTDTSGSIGRVPECLSGVSVDPVALQRMVSELSGATGAMIGGQSVRIDGRSGQKGRDLARAYLRERYLELGYDVAERPYQGGFGAGANLVAERPGDDRDFVIVSAHLDAFPESPGADDDASGIATAFAVAKSLKDCSFTHSLRLVAFDQEELGLVGSRAYASEIESETHRMLGMIQLEMTGYDSDRSGDYLLVHCDKPSSVAIADKVVAAVDTLELPLRHNLVCSHASDHAPFWAIGLPAIVLGEHFFSGAQQGPADPNPCYHQACDTADALDYEYMANLARATTLAVGALIGAR